MQVQEKIREPEAAPELPQSFKPPEPLEAPPAQESAQAEIAEEAPAGFFAVGSRVRVPVWPNLDGTASGPTHLVLASATVQDFQLLSTAVTVRFDDGEEAAQRAFPTQVRPGPSSSLIAQDLTPAIARHPLPLTLWPPTRSSRCFRNEVAARPLSPWSLAAECCFRPAPTRRKEEGVACDWLGCSKFWRRYVKPWAHQSGFIPSCVPCRGWSIFMCPFS